MHGIRDHQPRRSDALYHPMRALPGIDQFHARQPAGPFPGAFVHRLIMGNEDRPVPFFLGQWLQPRQGRQQQRTVRDRPFRPPDHLRRQRPAQRRHLPPPAVEIGGHGTIADAAGKHPDPFRLRHVVADDRADAAEQLAIILVRPAARREFFPEPAVQVVAEIPLRRPVIIKLHAGISRRAAGRSLRRRISVQQPGRSRQRCR